MISIQIENADKVAKNLWRYGFEIRQKLVRDIEYVGNRAIEILSVEFPESKITGQFFPQNMEYWVNVQGVQVCSVTNQFIRTRLEKQVGRGWHTQSGKARLDLIAEDLTKEAREFIQLSLHLTLK